MKKLNVFLLLFQTPESFPPLDLSSASVDVAADYTKRRHVLRFAAPGAELLLQAEGPADMQQWLRAMHDAGAKVSAVSNFFIICVAHKLLV